MNTGYGLPGAVPNLDSPDDDSLTDLDYLPSKGINRQRNQFEDSPEVNLKVILFNVIFEINNALNIFNRKIRDKIDLQIDPTIGGE